MRRAKSCKHIDVKSVGGVKTVRRAKSAKDLNTNVSRFRARPVPSFIYVDVKMSNKQLTIPESPNLTTRLRGARKLKSN
jgi:hypothetical protein